MVFLNNVEITKGNLEFVTMYIWAQGNKTHSFLSVKIGPFQPDEHLHGHYGINFK